MIWFTGGDTPLFGQMGMCHSTGCGLQGLLTISLFKPGQTYCVKKIMYFRRQLSRSSAQQGEAEGWTIRSTTDIFRKSQYFDSEVQNTLDCKKVVFFFFFFSKSVFQGERRRREIRFSREKNSYISRLDPLTVSFSAFTLAPVFRLASSSVLDLWTNTGSFTV